VRGLAHQLRQDGHAITILTESGPDLPDREEWDEGTIIRTPLLGGALPQPEIMLERWPQLVPFIEDAQPDIVLANNHTSIGTIPAAHAAGVPVVYSCHGWGLFCTLKIRLLRPDDTLCYNERRLETCLACQDMLAPPQPPRVAGKGRGLLRTGWRRLTWQRRRREAFRPLVARYDHFQDILESADARIGDSKMTASLFRSPRTFAVYYGIDTDHYRPVDSAPFRERFGLDGDYLFVSSRVNRTKGQDWAVRALAHLPEHIKLVLTGTPPHITTDAPPYLRRLYDLVADLGLRDRVAFTGYLEGDDLVQAYSGAAVTLVPSVWLEAFGYVTVEAMACESPVVVTSNCGSAELVEDGVNGYVVPRMDAQALAGAVLKALPQRDTLGRAARDTVIRELSWPMIAAQTLDVFQTAFAHHREQQRIDPRHA